MSNNALLHNEWCPLRLAASLLIWLFILVSVALPQCQWQSLIRYKCLKHQIAAHTQK
jgi:hypothetical protein